MRWTETILPTLKNIPADAEAISHILMLRAGLIRKLTSGVYSYLPLGLRVLKNVERIVRQEMDAKGAQEVLLPAIQPVDLWVKTGRFAALGEDMISFTDRHKKLNVLGPTHEEVITSLIRNEVNSYRQLPLIVYQIQTKFRDEARPRFGIMRAREFIMKDAYSFDSVWENLDKSYKKMYDAYCSIFKRCGLDYIAVEADTGIMGGNASHEFMVIAKNGEDRIMFCQSCGYSASIDKAECSKLSCEQVSSVKLKNRETLHTPGVSTVKDVADLLKTSETNLVKTLIYLKDNQPVAVLIRGGHQLNEAKLRHILQAKELVMADKAVVETVTNGPLGFSGPVGLKGVKIIADYALKNAVNFITGANLSDAHFVNVNLERDFTVDIWADIRNITARDVCVKCGAKIELANAIEVGHVFKLGTKYTQALGAEFIGQNGKSQPMIMGCYGIGVSRIIAACCEQNYDQFGIIWPKEIAPFKILLMLLNPADDLSNSTAQQCYLELQQKGIEVFLDDRNVRAGIKFKDADLIGIPVQVIIGEKNLSNGLVEIKIRKNNQRTLVPIQQFPEQVTRILHDL
ncbi:MAG: proline--tRNA ligase [Candidatus Omnitrophota bacterium]|nr:MAG: proline--tRNA ligase [Candidatus Omnitrophota bacterium]